MSIRHRLDRLERTQRTPGSGVRTALEMRDERCANCNACVPESETVLPLAGGPPEARLARCVVCRAVYLSTPGLRFLQQEAEADAVLAKRLAKITAQADGMGRLHHGPDARDDRIRQCLVAHWLELYENAPSRDAFTREGRVWRIRA